MKAWPSVRTGRGGTCPEPAWVQPQLNPDGSMRMGLLFGAARSGDATADLFRQHSSVQNARDAFVAERHAVKKGIC